MPTYQYSCTECGHFFEKVQSFSDEALTVCPACEGRLRKVFNAVGVVFKGSGFYRTDSRGGGGAAGDKAGSGQKADKADKTDKAGTAGSGAKADKPAAAAKGSGSASESAA